MISLFFFYSDRGKTAETPSLCSCRCFRQDNLNIKISDFKIICGGKVIPCPVSCTPSVCYLLAEMPSALAEIVSSCPMSLFPNPQWGDGGSGCPSDPWRCLGSSSAQLCAQQCFQQGKGKKYPQFFTCAKNWQKGEGWTSFNGKGRVDNIFFSGAGGVKLRPLQIVNTLFPSLRITHFFVVSKYKNNLLAMSKAESLNWPF